MDHTGTFEAYMLFRMSESEHVARTYPEQSAYDRYILEASRPYDEWLKANYSDVKDYGDA